MSTDPKFAIEKTNLLDLLEKVASVVPSKDAMPILKNIKLEVTAENKLRVIATDLELSIIAFTDKIATGRPGVCVLPARKFMEIVKESSGNAAVIDVEFGSATISVGSTRWGLKLADATHYPVLPEIVEIKLHQVPRMVLLDALVAVKGAMGTNPTRPQLCMIPVIKGRMLACDGSRFQQASLEFPMDVQIPSKAVEDLVKFLRASDQDTIDVGDTWNHLVFRIGPDIFIANKLTAEFPDVEQTLLAPALKNNEKLTVEREALISAIRQVRINADPDTLAINLNLQVDHLAIKGTDKFGNICMAKLDVEWIYGERLITINHKYLLDMLAMMTSPVCEFYLGQNAKNYRAPLMLKDDVRKVVGVVQQMRSDVLLSSLIRGKE